MTLARPEAARMTNHTAMNGPNRRARACVPNRWPANSTVSRVSVTGSTNDFSPGCAAPSPSTDAITLIAGVIVPSPKKSATPNIPSKTRAAFPARPFTRRPRTSATRAMMPPSPRLSAPMTKVTYLTKTTRTIVQITSEIIPSTPATSGRTPCTAKMELIAYRGLVPISPKTMPSAPRARAAAAAPDAPLAPFLPSRRAVAVPRGPPPAAGAGAPAARVSASAPARLGNPGYITGQPATTASPLDQDR